MEEETLLQNAKSNQQQFVNPVVTSDDLQDSEPLDLPTAPQPNDPSQFAESSFQAILNQFNQPVVEETNQNVLQGEILDTLKGLQGEAGRQEELRNEAGLPQQNEQLQGVINELTALSAERQAIPLQLQEESFGRARTAGGVAPLQDSRLRKNAIEGLRLSATAQALQGNIQLAEQTIQRTIDAEFEPQRQELEYLGQLYQFNKDALERVDKKRADNLGLMLGERARLIEIQQAERSFVGNTAVNAGAFGAPPDVVKQIMNSRNREEALALAAPYMQDPQAQQALRNGELNYQLNKIRIAREAEELAIYRRYGGLSPQQWYAQREQEEKERIASLENADRAVEEGRGLIQDITQIDAILDSPALGSVVGGSFLTRAPSSVLGGVGRVASIVGIPSLFGTVHQVTGKADDVIALTDQMLDKQFLDKLISVKSKGATFGALSDNEGKALRAAANAISSRRICEGGSCTDGGKTIGFDMSETEFRKQMDILQSTIHIAYERATGEIYTSDEQDFWNSLETGGSFNTSTPNYAGYF